MWYISPFYVYVFLHKYICMCTHVCVCIYFVCVYMYMQTPGSSSHSMRKPDRARQAISPSVGKMSILPSFGKPVCP